MAINLTKSSDRSSSPSLQELADNLQRAIDLHRSNTDASRRSSTSVMVPEPANFTSRTQAGPIAALAISPAHPEYMIVGTYALLKPNETSVSPGQVRTGSISVFSLSANFTPAYPGAAAPFLDEHSLDAAVLDIHFHPSDQTLFGVATSNARMSFFRLQKHADVHARRIEMKLLSLGQVEVALPDQHGAIPLITSFTWLPGFATVGKEAISDYHIVAFAATSSNGEIKLIKASVPAIQSFTDLRHSTHDTQVTVIRSVDLQMHTEEAWTVSAVIISKLASSLGDINKIAILSGGDDNALISTVVTMNPITASEPRSPTLCSVTLSPTQADSISPIPKNEDDSSSISPIDVPLPLESPSPILMAPAQHIWTDRKTHGAGVVAISALSPQAVPFAKHTAVPILTGSYDEHVRLFLLDSITLKRTPLLEKSLGGGVWRLKLMDETAEASLTGEKYSALVLASCMHGGVRILKVTHSTLDDTLANPEAQGWKIEVVMKFTKGHDSMNYASDFRKEKNEDGKFKGEYTIVSTSFYDAKVCVWKFLDESWVLV